MGLFDIFRKNKVNKDNDKSDLGDIQLTNEQRISGCDVCGKQINWSDGYILTTKQVVTSFTYWNKIYKKNKQMRIDPNGDMVGANITQLSSQTSGWLICESCSNLFDFNKIQARYYAINQIKSPPGSGPVRVEEVVVPAVKAWQNVYGKWPSSINR